MSDKSISTESIEQYVKFGGEFCPFCKSPEVIQDGPLYYDNENSKVYRGVMCLSCIRDWTDVFTLNAVIPQYNPLAMKDPKEDEDDN